MKRLGIVIAVAALAAAPAWGAIVNPGFENGLVGWTWSAGGGNGSVSNAIVNGPWTAPEGLQFALLLTDTGLNSNNVTTLHQVASLNAGDKVQFKYWFWDDSRSFVAQAAVNLINGGNTNLVNLVGQQSNTPPGTWLTVTTLPVPTTGNYDISIQIQDGGTSVKRAGMGVDIFAVLGSGGVDPVDDGTDDGNGDDNGNGNGAVPEPMTMLAGLLGLASLAGYIRRSRA